MARPIPVQSGYDRWASVYDLDGNPLQALEEPLLNAALGEVADLDVLDLGCGTGRHTLRMAADGARVTAVDFSEKMLAEARRKPGAEHVRFVVHDLHHSLPFAADFDLVVCSLVLEHIENVSSFYQEIRRAVRTDGRVVISLMHPAMFLKGSQARFTDPELDELVVVDSRPHSVSDLVMAALQANFKLTSISEHSPDAELAKRYPRAEKYIGWPMLVVQCLTT